MTASDIYIGTAGWSIPSVLAGQFGAEGSHLERYASRLKAVEINSSFYRPHRRATYERWAASVPDDFRFAIKLPKAITHQRRLRDCGDLLTRFHDEVSGLGEKQGPVLVQLPPSLPFDAADATRFFAQLCAGVGGTVVCEPRHPSWFGALADQLLVDHHVARVAADPPVVPEALRPGGWAPISYIRLHGAPQIYRSDYPPASLDRYAGLIRAWRGEGRQVWTIFDNTAAGHAAANALALRRFLERA